MTITLKEPRDHARLYPYVFPINEIGEPEIGFWAHTDLNGALQRRVRKVPDFRSDGTVWSRAPKRPRSLGVWYAVIGNHYGSTKGQLIRRDKLNDVAKIEDLHWRLQVRLQGPVMERRRKAMERANELGRIWCDGEFRYSSRDGSIEPRGHRNDESANHAVDQLANIPTPEEEEAGEEWRIADQQIHDYWRRIGTTGTVLKKAFEISDRFTMPHNGMRSQSVFVKIVVNGREYINYTQDGWSQNTTEIWPRPSDNRQVVDFGSV